MNRALLLLFCLGAALAVQETDGSPDYWPTRHHNKTTTTSDPTTTTKKHRTTTEKTTEVPTTTTKKPPTTTKKPTEPPTTTKNQDTTTNLPTTVEPPTTVSPGPINPKHAYHNTFEWEDLKNNTVFKAEFALSMTVSYETKEGNETKKEKTTLNVPEVSKKSSKASKEDAFYTVNASDDEAQLFIHWKKVCDVTLTWNKVNGSGEFALTGFDLDVQPSDILPKVLSLGNNSLELYATKINKTYVCESANEQQIAQNKKTNESLSIQISQFKVLALSEFDKRDKYNSDRSVCAADAKVEHLIPIIVGCVLAGLIVVVILAYVVATRYKKYHGYETL